MILYFHLIVDNVIIELLLIYANPLTLESVTLTSESITTLTFIVEFVIITLSSIEELSKILDFLINALFITLALPFVKV